MPRGHEGLPRSIPSLSISKRHLYERLALIDRDARARERVLHMETSFKARIASHLRALPTNDARLQKFNTSPFVLMFYSRQKGYHHVAQIENDIVPAKVFSSMETSAGRMVEEVVLPVYGWQVVPSTMHSEDSVLDGRRSESSHFECATLKSGPRCLNDEIAKDIGVDVATHALKWARKHNAQKVDFTYGVLYGTKRLSNKKDWHILRNIAETVAADAQIVSPPRNAWSVRYVQDRIDVTATVRIGAEWWTYLGGPDAWIELCVALVRACVAIGPVQRTAPTYTIADLASILDLSSVPDGFNISLLQQSQFEWLQFLARHFCDELTP